MPSGCFLRGAANPDASLPRGGARHTGEVSTIRLVTLDDAPALVELLVRDRAFMAPWEPDRPEVHYTLEGQREALEKALEAHDRGAAVPLVIVRNGRVVGRITLNDIVRGAFQSTALGYWVTEAANGRGLATAAVRDTLAYAFGELGLHRVEASTLPGNIRSQRVLKRNGFVWFAVAPEYLKIAGRWQDHVLFQKVSPSA